MKLPLSLADSGRAIDVLAIGENSVDLLAVVDGPPPANAKRPLVDYMELPGGEAATAAVGVARLGWRAKYIGRFGDDRFGTMGREALATAGVDVKDAVVVENTPSRLAVILVDRRSGDRTVLWRRDARLTLRPDDIPDAAIEQSRILLVGSDDVEAMTSAAHRARQRGVRTVGDLEHVHAGTPALLEQLDVIVMAATFPEALTGKSGLGAALRAVATMTRAALICVTLGSEGCLALAGGKELHVPAFMVDVVDTTGAGDLFRAGLMARWLADPTQPGIVELLRYANAAAALNCRGIGAQTAVPRRDEVEALLRT